MPNEILVKSIPNKSTRRDSWFLDDYTVASSCYTPAGIDSVFTSSHAQNLVLLDFDLLHQIDALGILQLTLMKK